ncbi:MAG: hydantoinase/oxoprolinase family protein, partial [Ilumatobacteraceae bacterium]
DGEVVSGTQTSVDYGLVIRTPMIEISTIGAGGGSIAWVDAGGILRIGPESAGSVPGPACYGRGNDRPTVTDAHLVLGRINGDVPIGGLDRLDRDAAAAAIDTHVGTPLGLDEAAAAEAILRVATSRMAGAIRLVSLERGHDPSRFVAMPFGGAGALHACGLVTDVGLKGALVPRYPGVVSAYGCVIADVRHDIVHTLDEPLATLDVAELRRRLAAAGVELETFLERSGLQLDDVTLRHELDMSYVGQTHTVSVPLTGGEVDRDGIADAFTGAYTRAYGRVLDSIPVRLLSARSIVVGSRPELDPALFAPSAGGSSAPSAERDVYFAGEWFPTPVYDRLALPVGTRVGGPAVLEQPDATVVIEPGFGAEVDRFGNLEVRTG